jgi:Exocyst complex component SEC3 N-terminal PIP2 binding PH
MADQRQRIISSVFSRRNATGNLEESYVSHIKVWEDAGSEGGGRKPRYILLSRVYSTIPFSNVHFPNISVEASNGTGFIHKSKLNTNGTFSVGKTWRLAELRAIQVVDVCSILFCCCSGAEYYLESSHWLSTSPCQEHTSGKLKIKRISPLFWRLWSDFSVLLPLRLPCTWMACQIQMTD